jgi:DNA-binding MarR family transcriptional regulator
VLDAPRQLLDRLVRLSINLRTSERELVEITSGMSSTLQDLEVLVLLDPKRGRRHISSNLLRRMLVLTSGAMAHRLDRLEATGRVRRVRPISDRRQVLIELTPAGLAELRRVVQEQVHGTVSEALTGVEARLRQALAPPDDGRPGQASSAKRRNLVAPQ